MTCPAASRPSPDAGGGGNVTIPHKEAAAQAVARRLDDAAEVERVQRVLERGRRGGRRQHRRRGPARGPWSRWSRRRVPGSSSAPAGAREPPRSPRRAVARPSRSPPARRSAPPRSSAGCGDRGLRTAPAAAVHAWSSTPRRSASAPMIPLPLEPDAVPRAGVAFDMVYRTGETPWVRAMRASGPPRRRRARHAGGAGSRGPPSAGFRASTPPVEIMRRRGGCRASLSCARGSRSSSAGCCRPPASSATRRSPPATATRWSVRSAVPAGGRCPGRSATAAASLHSAISPAGSAPTGRPALRRVRSAVWLDAVARDAQSIGSSTRAGGGSRNRWPRRCEASSH